MRIILNADGRVLEGTPVAIVRQMQELAFGQQHLSLSDYMDWAAERLEQTEGTRLLVMGLSDEEKARSFVDAMVEAGVARRG
jgi:hypothetical protein